LPQKIIFIFLFYPNNTLTVFLLHIGWKQVAIIASSLRYRRIIEKVGVAKDGGRISNTVGLRITGQLRPK
jgi:hypothetical protein